MAKLTPQKQKILLATKNMLSLGEIFNWLADPANGGMRPRDTKSPGYENYIYAMMYMDDLFKNYPRFINLNTGDTISVSEDLLQKAFCVLTTAFSGAHEKEDLSVFQRLMGYDQATLQSFCKTDLTFAGALKVLEAYDAEAAKVWGSAGTQYIAQSQAELDEKANWTQFTAKGIAATGEVIGAVTKSAAELTWELMPTWAKVLGVAAGAGYVYTLVSPAIRGRIDRQE